MREAFIVEAVRTPVGRGREDGALHGVYPVDLLAAVLAEVTKRAGVDKAQVEDVVGGCVSPTSEQGANLPRLALLKAGFPVEVPGVQVNRMCGSSQQAAHFVSQAIISGDMDLAIAAGVEMMGRVPMGSDWGILTDDFLKTFPYPLTSMGVCAEKVAAKWNLSRRELDEFSAESHVKAVRAIESGHFKSQILPIAVKRNGDSVIVSGEKADALGLKKRARIKTRVVVGSDPELTLSGPIPATQKALAKAGLKIDDMDVIEINEAFASVVLAWAKEIKPKMDRVNPNGGAIALGHPLGATGAILMTKIVHELERTGARYGLQTMCIGHGMATATIIERVGA
ncbi:MAG: thiolase family protein [Candidatus Hydrogenedentes bacterium]|nr:thiolase family protein [Candidatus Hydrogenedentota bacterium]